MTELTANVTTKWFITSELKMNSHNYERVEEQNFRYRDGDDSAHNISWGVYRH